MPPLSKLEEKVPEQVKLSSLLSVMNILLCFEFRPRMGAKHELALTSTQLRAEQSRAEPIVCPNCFFFPAQSQTRPSRFLPFLCDGKVLFL